MKTIAKGMAILLALLMLLPAALAEQKRAVYYQGVAQPVDKNRACFNLGSAKTLAEDVYFVVLLSSDDESAWTEEAIRAYQSSMQQAVNFIWQYAGRYGYERDYPLDFYATNERRDIHYDGVVANGGTLGDALNIIARNWGYTDKYAMHAAMQKKSGKDQVLYILAVNKANYIYAGCDDRNDLKDELEYCVIPLRDQNRVTADPSVMVHEMLHCFGGEDFYRKEIGGIRYNDRRAALAEKLHPGAVMLGPVYSLAGSAISPFTAWSVGWLDRMPAQYDCDDWWQDTQYRKLFPYSANELQ